MKKIILLTLVMIMLFTATGCQKTLFKSGDTANGFHQNSMNALVETNKIISNKNDVTLDFSYGFYKLDEISIEQAKARRDYWDNDLHYQRNYAIYISNNEKLEFDKDENGNLIDPKNNVNAILYKFFTYEEAFEKNYGFDFEFFKIKYCHSEKITIPEELFISSSEYVYIHIVIMTYELTNDKFTWAQSQPIIPIKYKLIGNDIVVLVDE